MRNSSTSPTDGESYGHHHAHGDMALAYALDRFSKDPDIRLTNYGEFLALHPPECEVEIHDNTSWSCEQRRRTLAVELRLQHGHGLAAAMARTAASIPSTGSKAASIASLHQGERILARSLGGS